MQYEQTCLQNCPLTTCTYWRIAYMSLSTTFMYNIYPVDMHDSKVHIIDLLSLLYTSKYNGAKESTGFRILKTLIQNPKGEAWGLYKYLKYSKDCRSHWLKCLTCLDSSMLLLSYTYIQRKLFFRRSFFLYSLCHYMRAWICVLDAPGCYEHAVWAEKSPHYKAQDCYKAVCTKKSGLQGRSQDSEYGGAWHCARKICALAMPIY